MHRIISWFVDNSVAANLLMWILLIGGAIALMRVHQEEFPNVEIKSVSVNVPYLGAAPEEAEQGVCIRIEEAVEGTEGIDRIESTASEGACSVAIILTEDADSSELATATAAHSRSAKCSTCAITLRPCAVALWSYALVGCNR